MYLLHLTYILNKPLYTKCIPYTSYTSCTSDTLGTYLIPLYTMCILIYLLHHTYILHTPLQSLYTSYTFTPHNLTYFVPSTHPIPHISLSSHISRTPRMSHIPRTRDIPQLPLIFVMPHVTHTSRPPECTKGDKTTLDVTEVNCCSTLD